MQNEDKITCAFSGHRSIEEKAEIIYKLHEAISYAVLENNVTRFLSGMACGFDMMAAETVLSFKRVYPQVKLICVIPHKEQDKYFTALDKKRYAAICQLADEIIYTGESYTPWCMHVRDDYLVDHAQHLICYLTQTSGGTFYTVSRAKKRQISIKNLAL